MDWIVAIIVAVVAAALGAAGGYLYRKQAGEKKIGRTEEYARNLLEDAQRKADEKKKETILEAKEEVLRLKTELDRECRERRAEVQRSERRILQREESLDKKQDALETREEALGKKQNELQKMQEDIENDKQRQVAEMERIAGMTQDEACQMLVSRIQKDAYHDAAAMVREIETRAREEGEKKARNIIALAIQKCAADHVAESTVSVINLPNDDMKGRIIGREGRNIRALETATGVDLIIDDTPEAVIVSAFDPVRREIARIAVERLIMDGRIHPARIEEMVEKARKEVDQQIREAGEQAVFETASARHPSRAGQDAGPSALPHQLWPERAQAFHRGQPIWPASWPPSWALTWRWPSGRACCTTSARRVDHEMEGPHVAARRGAGQASTGRART